MTRRHWGWVVAVGFVATLAAVEPARAQCAVGFSQVPYAATFGCYQLTATSATWTDAQAAATTLGGNLAAIGSAAENSAVRSFVNGQIGTSPVWIGLTDQAVEGTFAWISGEPVSYTNWDGGEPNNFGGNEDYTELRGSGGWNDLPAGSTMVGLVEQSVATVPEPVSLVLVGSGLAALGVIARRRRHA